MSRHDKTSITVPDFSCLSLILALLFVPGFAAQAQSIRSPAQGPAASIRALPGLEYRQWRSDSGDTIEAAFIHLHQGHVVLKARDDSQIAIPIHRLIWRDQIAARRLSERTDRQAIPTGLRRAAQGRQPANARVIAEFGSECASLLRSAIADANKEILMAIYTFTSSDIADALIQASKRGVHIHIKFDGGQIGIGQMDDLISMLNRKRNITITPVTMRGRFSSMHHKFAIIDQIFVFTGSFNFTVMASTQNYENAVLIESEKIVDRFTKEFEAIESR